MSNYIDVFQSLSKEDSATGGLSLLKEIPKFTGNKFNEATPQEVRIFIRKVEVAAQFSKVDDLASIAYMKLFGAAACFAESDPDMQNAIKDGDWAAFKSKLLRMYAPRHSWTDLELSMFNSKQRKRESCHEFLSRLRTLKDDTLHAMLREDISTQDGEDLYLRIIDDRVRRCFCKGLRSNEFSCMASGARDEMTVDELADRVTDWELSHKNQDEHMPKYQ
jgi:hypothetical protein